MGNNLELNLEGVKLSDFNPQAKHTEDGVPISISLRVFDSLYEHALALFPNDAKNLFNKATGQWALTTIQQVSTPYNMEGIKATFSPEVGKPFSFESLKLKTVKFDFKQESFIHLILTTELTRKQIAQLMELIDANFNVDLVQQQVSIVD